MFDTITRRRVTTLGASLVLAGAGVSAADNTPKPDPPAAPGGPSEAPFDRD